MLISSSKFSTCSSQYIKATQRFDKVSLQRSKISSQGVAKSLMKERICHIQKELVRLDENPSLCNYFAHAHYLFFIRSPYVPRHGSGMCQETAYAIIQRNLFDHKLFRELDSLEKCELELKDEEEGTFLVRMSQRFFVDGSGEERQFQGHTFIIVKMIEGDNTSYLIAQSFVERYSLKSFILENRMIYDSYDELKEKVLTPLKSILEKSGNWTDKECRAHYQMTDVFPGWLIGFSPPKHNLLEAARFGRSSNIAIEGKKTLSLGTFVNGKLMIPDEWGAIIKANFE